MWPLTCSILSMVVPVYNAELSPKSLRGRLVSLNQLAITAGIMVSVGVRVLLLVKCNMIGELPGKSRGGVSGGRLASVSRSAGDPGSHSYHRDVLPPRNTQVTSHSPLPE